jgi:hypothetical protein
MISTRCRPWKWQIVESMGSHKAGFPPSRTLCKSLQGSHISTGPGAESGILRNHGNYKCKSQITPIAVQPPCNGCVRVQDITTIPAHLHEVVSYRMKDTGDSIPPKKMSNWMRRSVTKKMSTPSTSLREPISVEVGTQTPEPSSHDDSARPCIGVSSPCMRRPPRITIHRHQARQS